MLALYSTVTALAYAVNQEFYSGIHYVWCAPAPASDSFLPRNPDSSDPWWLFEEYAKDIKKGEQHSALIERNRSGIIRGAEHRHAQGIIDLASMQLIKAMVDEAKLDEFKPLFMVIGYDSVHGRGLIASPEIAKRARSTSREYIIENLPRQDFEV